MALLGLSIIIASVSFLCYRHPPSSWSFLSWLQRPTLHDVAKQRPHAPPSISLHDGPSTSEEPSSSLSKAALDRKAMPPPPPPFKKPTPKSPSPPKSPGDDKTPTVPTFTLSSSPPAPSFPAANSAQRASGTRTPTSQFPAANSAQRAQGGTGAPPRLSALPTKPQGLMSPLSRSPVQLPNRTPTASTFSLAPPPTHTSIPTKPRKKVLLTPGHSPLDWARISSSPTANLRGLPPSTPYLRVPPSLLKQMTGRKGKNAWTVLGGKVYNISPYLPYHPGGEPELLKAAGRDGTRLFGEVHPWVNWEGMLEACLVGIAVEEGEVTGSGGLEEMD